MSEMQFFIVGAESTHLQVKQPFLDCLTLTRVRLGSFVGKPLWLGNAIERCTRLQSLVVELGLPHNGAN